MFDIIKFTLAAAVVDTGTLTASYPSGRSKASYYFSGRKHTLSVNGNKMRYPQDFTLTFNANASGITVTNASGSTWPQGAACTLQVDRPGYNDFDLLMPSTQQRDRLVPALTMLVNIGSPTTADADGIAASQSVGAGAAFSINGALASGGTVEFDVPRNVVAAWTTTSVLTITGTDEFGAAVVETSASGTSHTGKKAFKKITSVTSSASITSATVGSGEKLGLPLAIRHGAQVLREYRDGLSVGGAPGGKIRLPWFADEASVTTGSTYAIELIAPCAGYISKLAVVVRGAVGTGGAVTVKVGTTDVTGLSVTVANSATKGTTGTDTPTTFHGSTTVVAKGDRIQIVFDDAFATTGALDGYLEIDPAEDVLNGTLVTADATEATGTTGDVRGTYTPADASDGSFGVQLLIFTMDPTDIGTAQYAG